MVHDGGAGGRWQGQRVTPAVTRSRVKRDGLRPGMFALMATQEDVQAHAGPHSGIWTEAEGRELRGLNATGTFEGAGSE